MQPDLPEFVLYVWPDKWELPSIDPSCLAAIFHLQLTIPGRFAIAQVTNPDLSPTGQLPFLTHQHRVVSPLVSIIKYVASLKTITRDGSEKNVNADLDAALDHTERAQRAAWCAHVESHVGDLLAHTFYYLPDNYARLIHPCLASLLPIPQRYYVPGRLRASHRPRLEACGLWVSTDEEERKDPEEIGAFGIRKLSTSDAKAEYKKTFERERVSNRARSLFAVYTRLLSGNEFLFHNQPTSFDILLAAHVLLLTVPPFPDPLIGSLLTNQFPTLVAHARRVQERAFPDDAVFASIPRASSSGGGFSVRSLLPQLYGEAGRRKKARTPEDVKFDRMRWGFIALMMSTAAVFLWTGGADLRVQLMRGDEENEEYDEEGDDEGGEDGEQTDQPEAP